MGDTLTVAAPTLREAREAAEAMLSEGATKVLLFGSLARGEATERSDLDFLAVVDDLGDYSQRADVADRLQRAAARSVVDRHCDVLVTDRPELEHLVANVSASLRACIAQHGLLLADLGPQQEINWNKEMVVSKNNTEEAAKRLKEAEIQMVRLMSESEAGRLEYDAWKEGRRSRYLYLREGRMAQVLGCGHLAIELSLKCLAGLTAGQVAPYKHKTEELLEVLPSEVQEKVREMMGSLEHKDIDHWHISRNYEGNIPQGARPASEELSVEMTNVAYKLLNYAADIGETQGISSDILEEVRESSLAAVNLLNATGVGPDLSDVSSPDVKPVQPKKRSLWSRLFSKSSKKKISAPVARDDNEFLLDEPLPSRQFSACDRWMPRSKSRCVLPKGHGGHCRSR